MFREPRYRSGSFIEMEASKLTVLCKRMLERVEDRRNQERQKIGERYIREIENTNKWRKRFFLKPHPIPTWQEAFRDYAKTHTMWEAMDAVMADLIWERNEDAAKKLMNLARHGDPVRVTGEDLDLIT